MHREFLDEAPTKCLKNIFNLQIANKKYKHEPDKLARSLRLCLLHCFYRVWLESIYEKLTHPLAVSLVEKQEVSIEVGVYLDLKEVLDKLQFT